MPCSRVPAAAGCCWCVEVPWTCIPAEAATAALALAGATGQFNTVRSAFFACLDAALHSERVAPEPLEKVWELAAAWRHSLVLPLWAAHAPHPGQGLPVLQQKLWEVSDKLEEVDRLLAEGGTQATGANTAETLQNLLHDTLTLYLGMCSPWPGQPAAGPAAAYSLYYAGSMSRQASGLMRARLGRLDPRQQMLCLEALALASSAAMRAVDSLCTMGPLPSSPLPSRPGALEFRLLVRQECLLKAFADSLPAWAAAPQAQPDWQQDRTLLALRAAEAVVRLAGQLLQRWEHIVPALADNNRGAPQALVSVLVLECLLVSNFLLKMLVLEGSSTGLSGPPHVLQHTSPRQPNWSRRW